MDQHSIQAPFAYQFFNKLITSIKSSKIIDEIEHERQVFIRDNSVIEGDDLGAGSKMARNSTVSSIARYGISSKKNCRFLRELVNITKSATCVELGTSLGIATAYLAHSNSMKKIYSFEGNSALAEKAKTLFNKLNIDNVQIIEGNIDIELPAFMETVESIDLAIVDANHTKNALIGYYQILKFKMNTHSVLFIDDIRWSREMYAGWKDLIQRQEVTLSMEFLHHGLLFFEKGIPKQHYILTI